MCRLAWAGAASAEQPIERRTTSMLQARSTVAIISAASPDGTHCSAHTRFGVHPDMRLHPEVPLVSLLRLVHLRIPFSPAVLRRRRRVNAHPARDACPRHPPSNQSPQADEPCGPFLQWRGRSNRSRQKYLKLHGPLTAPRSFHTTKPPVLFRASLAPCLGGGRPQTANRTEPSKAERWR